jgi:hypothetical protein
LPVAEIADQLADLGPDPFPPIPPTRIVTDPNFEGIMRWMATAHGLVACKRLAKAYGLHITV